MTIYDLHDVYTLNDFAIFEELLDQQYFSSTWLVIAWGLLGTSSEVEIGAGKTPKVRRNWDSLHAHIRLPYSRRLRALLSYLFVPKLEISFVSLLAQTVPPVIAQVDTTLASSRRGNLITSLANTGIVCSTAAGVGPAAFIIYLYGKDCGALHQIMFLTTVPYCIVAASFQLEEKKFQESYSKSQSLNPTFGSPSLRRPSL